MNRIPPALLGAVLLTACGERAEEPRPLTGLVDATEIDVAAKVPGRVRALLVKEGDLVGEGQPLAEIESDELGARLDQASATIAAAEARLRLAQRGARKEDREAAQRQLEAAQHQVELASKMFERMKQLLETGSIPQAAFDDAEAKHNLARDQLALAQTRLDLAQRGARTEELEALQALVRQAEGVRAEVAAYRKETVLVAPIAGEVAKVVLHKGELAATGYPVVTLVDRKDSWITFPVREDLLRQLPVGTALRVEVPALGTTLTAQVFSIAALGDFAVWKATTEKKGFDLKSFEVKARPAEVPADLRPGMTARWTPAR